MKEETVAARRHRSLECVKVLLKDVVDEYLTRLRPRTWAPPEPIEVMGKSKLMDMIRRPAGISHQDAEWCIKRLLATNLLQEGDRVLIDDGTRSRYEEGFVPNLKMWGPQLVQVGQPATPGAPTPRYPGKRRSWKRKDNKCKVCGLPVFGQHAKPKYGHTQEDCRLEVARLVMSL